MTFATLASYVVNGLLADGDSMPSLPSAAPYYSTAWGIRLGILLRQFTRDALLLYTHMASITVAADVQVLDLSDPAVSDTDFFEVHKIWLDNVLIGKYSGADVILSSITPTDAASTPTAFAQLDSQKIIFNCKTADAISNCYAQGFYRHPSIAADTDVISGVIEDHLDLFSRYAQAHFREGVAADEIGMARLRRVDQQAYDAIQELRGERMYNMLSVAYRC